MIALWTYIAFSCLVMFGNLLGSHINGDKSNFARWILSIVTAPIFFPIFVGMIIALPKK